MKKLLFTNTILALAIFALTGCPGGATNTTNTVNTRTNTTVSNANMMTNSNTAVVVNSNTNMTDSNMNMSNSTSGATSPSDFMMEAAKGGMAEVELSRLALTKAQNAEVKQFAQRMVQDHTNANTELKQLAGKKNVTLPTELDAKHKATRDELAKLSGAEFDREYVSAMVEDHQKDVNLFRMQSESGTDADAKALAAKTLPILQMHLKMIQDIQGKMK
ncbi:MAG: DUF4142 domain-containing protein [Acidobacteria bacterium]|nr:DUF4142 domain-containing protein [Acidobacteriota bacterium]MCA1636927.1 DUF4142 domain-containing protein [Acidobacteriota bacterium]